MGYAQSLVNGFKCLFLDQQAMTDLAGDEKATGHGFLTLALLGVIYGLLMGAVTMMLLGIVGLIISLVMAVIMSVVGFIIGYSIYHFLAKLFGGQATGSEYFRTTANFMVVSVVLIALSLLMMALPQVGLWLSYLFQLWMLVVLVVILKAVHKLPTWKAVVVALIPVIIVLLIVGTAGISLLAGGTIV